MTSDRKSAKYLLAALPQGDSFMDIVEHYLKNNLPIFPVNNLKKVTAETWMRDFELNEFKKGQTALAIRLGIEIPGYGYLVCIDFDCNNKALFLKFANSLRDYEINPDTVTVKTGGQHDGYHLYFLMNEEPPGIDVRLFGDESVGTEFRGKGHYCILPPSAPNNRTCFKNGKECAPLILKPYARIDKPGELFNLEDCKKITLMQWEKAAQALPLKGSHQKEPCSIDTGTSGGIQDVYTTAYSPQSRAALPAQLPARKADNPLGRPPKIQGVYTNPYEVSSPFEVMEGNIKPLWNDPILWGRILYLLYRDVYGEDEVAVQKSRWDKAHKCVMHKEENPSAHLIRSYKTGDLVYKEYHEKECFSDKNGKTRNKEIFLLHEVYLRCRQSRGEIHESVGRGEAWKYIVKEANYWTPRALEIKKIWDELRPQLSFLFPAVLRVADTMIEIATLEARTGTDKQGFIAALPFVRRLMKRAGPTTIQKSRDLLCYLELFKTVGTKKFKSGRSTYIYEINENIDPAIVYESFHRCQEAGIKRIDHFNLRAIDRYVLTPDPGGGHILIK